MTPDENSLHETGVAAGAIGSIHFESIPGIGPDGKPATYHFAEGALWSFKCPDCGETNGGCIINETHTKAVFEADEYSPVNLPCIFCGKGPMQWDGPHGSNASRDPRDGDPSNAD